MKPKIHLALMLIVASFLFSVISMAQAAVPPIVSILALDADAAEAGLDAGALTVLRTGDTTHALIVNYSVSGSATAGSDYSALSGSVTILAGSSTAAIAITPADDALMEGSETVIATLTADANYTVGSQNSATVTIADDELAVATIAATDADAAEAGLSAGAFTVTRSGDATGTLTVNYTVSGPATAGSDYTALSGSVTILAGSSTAAITVTPIDDTLIEGSETVIATLTADASYTVGSQSSATVNIADDEQTSDLPVVTVTATDANATEAGLDTGTLTAMRSGDAAGALTVNYSVSGSATAGSDYSTLSGSVIISAGASTATITVSPLQDTLVEGSETVIATLTASVNYTTGSQNSATVAIADDDQSVVSITATDANAAEAGLATGMFTVSRAGDATNSLTISYSVTGSAAAGSDYSALSGTVIIPAGAGTATITVSPLQDTLVEGSETVIATLTANTNYTVGGQNNATVTIADNHQSDEPGGTRPGWGCGDSNHEHSGPPGHGGDKDSPCDRGGNRGNDSSDDDDDDEADGHEAADDHEADDDNRNGRGSNNGNGKGHGKGPGNGHGDNGGGRGRN